MRAPREFPRAVAILMLLAVVLMAGLALAAEGDAARGKALYDARCIACHSPDANRVGPAHKGVVGRKAGAASGYTYSPALKASQVVWSEATLRAWLADPEKAIPGQKMGYSVASAEDRDHLVAYLKTLR
jgi:cytochrome c